jgi:hypothetical protein
MDVITLQPIDCFSIHPLYADEWVRFIKRIVDECKKQGIPKKELASLFPNPSALGVQLFFLANDLKTSKTPKSDRIEILKFLLEILSEQRISDPFVQGKKNYIYSHQELQTLLNNIQLLPADEEIARQLARIYLGGSHLAYALYTDNYPDFGIENNGPYAFPENSSTIQTLVIKEMLNLRPIELFSATKKVAANHIQIFCVYENVKTKIEAVSCHYSYEGNPIKGLRQWALIADDKQVTKKEELMAVEQNLSENAVEQWQRIKSLDEEPLKQKMVQLRCYLFKKICDRLRIDWNPPAEMLDAVKGKALVTDLYALPENKQDEKKYWEKILDPRIDFYP